MTAGRIRPAVWALGVLWLAVGALLVEQVRIPDLARPLPATRRAAVACWVVRVASGPAAAPSLRRDLRRLRRAGLRAELRPGRGTQTRVAVIPARSRSTARAARDRAVQLGFPRSRVLGLPRSACRR
jgi:hypothetical protein